MPHRPVVVALLLLAAVILHLALVQEGIATIVTHRDGSARESMPAPVLGTVRDMRMLGCAVRGEPATTCPDSSIAQIDGAFPRAIVPWGVALVGGLLAPLIFIGASVWLAISKLTGWVRVIIGISLILAAAAAAVSALVVAAASGLSMLFTWNTAFVSSRVDLLETETLGLGLAIGLASLSMGIILLVKAWRGRKKT